MAFVTFVACYVPMCFVIGVACAAISASAWPFVVPILLSFEVFGDFKSIFDPVLLSIIIDLSNAMVLCFIYQRKGKVAWHPATVRCERCRRRRRRRRRRCCLWPCCAGWLTEGWARRCWG